MADTESTSYDNSERERMASMLENWFQQRMSMSNKALRLILLPMVAVVLAAAVFWFNYYIPVPVVFLAALFGLTLLVWVICLFLGGRLIRRVRTGDSLMLRKIRSMNAPDEG